MDTNKIIIALLKKLEEKNYKNLLQVISLTENEKKQINEIIGGKVNV